MRRRALERVLDLRSAAEVLRGAERFASASQSVPITSAPGFAPDSPTNVRSRISVSASQVVDVRRLVGGCRTTRPSPSPATRSGRRELLAHANCERRDLDQQDPTMRRIISQREVEVVEHRARQPRALALERPPADAHARAASCDHGRVSNRCRARTTSAVPPSSPTASSACASNSPVEVLDRGAAMLRRSALRSGRGVRIIAEALDGADARERRSRLAHPAEQVLRLRDVRVARATAERHVEDLGAELLTVRSLPRVDRGTRCRARGRIDLGVEAAVAAVPPDGARRRTSRGAPLRSTVCRCHEVHVCPAGRRGGFRPRRVTRPRRAARREHRPQRRDRDLELVEVGSRVVSCCSASPGFITPAPTRSMCLPRSGSPRSSSPAISGISTMRRQR